MKVLKRICFLLLVCSIMFVYGFAYAEQFKIAIMQEEKGAAQKYTPLVTYLAQKGVEVSFVGAQNYPAAAQMFADRKVDAMFSGSGVAGIMIIKNLGTPLVRPVGKDGHSTYWATIIAPKGSPKFTGNAVYFKNKKVVYTPLASSGEFYFRSIPNIKSANVTVQLAASHGAAIDTLSRGIADVAIVKNRLWEKMKNDYPNLVNVGEDTAENPDGTLIVSRKAEAGTISKVSNALLSLRDDTSPQAQAVREQLNIQGYIKTTTDDFKHTLEILKMAGVDKSFNFVFK